MKLSTYSGHVWLFGYDGSAWRQLGQAIAGEAANDQSGYAVALNASGSRVAVGSPFSDRGGESSGHVQVWEFFNKCRLWKLLPYKSSLLVSSHASLLLNIHNLCLLIEKLNLSIKFVIVGL